MTRESQRFDRVEQHLTRRRALAGGATLLAAGGTLHVLGDEARASVAIGDLTIPDASLTGERVTPVVDVAVDYDYDVGETAIGALEFALSVDEAEVATAELVTDRTTFEGTTDLAGPVTDAAAWDRDDFSPAVAESVEHTLTVGLALDVTAPDGTSIVADSVTEDVTVVVSHPQESKRTAEVGGSGVVRTATSEE